METGEVNTLLTEAIRQAPALAVLAWMVWTFLKHLDKRDMTLTQIGTGCHMVQREAMDVMRETNGKLGEVTVALQENSRTMDRVRDYMSTSKV